MVYELILIAIQLLVFTREITPRLQYIFELIIEEILGMKLELTTDKDHFVSVSQPKINYSELFLESSLRIKPAGLLFEQDIREQDLYVPSWKNMKVFYLADPDSDLPFDLFAASFFMVSRYEEYLNPELDFHGRFDTYQSLSYRNDFHNNPVVDMWALELEKCLKEKFPAIKKGKRIFRSITTLDIDEQYAFRYKGFARTVGGIFKSGNRKIKGETRYRLSVLFGRKKDPYQTFDLLREWHERYRTKPVFFFLVGKYGKYDKNLSIRKKAYKRLVREISDRYDIGIHPSYRSNIDPEILKEEKNALQEEVGKPVIRSRQHYLKLEIPHTYRNLIRLGIREDYSMGFPAETGFRAGIATPFYFYDLLKEEKTNLKIFPFHVMDGTLNDYLRMEPKEGLERISLVMNEVKAVKGTFISLWHNSSLSEWGQWEGWRAVYEEMLKMASGQG
ncbi:MAG: polysaccharide deacetylase family protein [Bacteroidales bacterium]|nr:MAG: polysaccharide deacetylase family protein [Bacteroidales bacterium]